MSILNAKNLCVFLALVTAIGCRHDSSMTYKETQNNTLKTIVEYLKSHRICYNSVNHAMIKSIPSASMNCTGESALKEGEVELTRVLIGLWDCDSMNRLNCEEEINSKLNKNTFETVCKEIDFRKTNPNEQQFTYSDFVTELIIVGIDRYYQEAITCKKSESEKSALLKEQLNFRETILEIIRRFHPIIENNIYTFFTAGCEP
jgi:hypothetical protein